MYICCVLNFESQQLLVHRQYFHNMLLRGWPKFGRQQYLCVRKVRRRFLFSSLMQQLINNVFGYRGQFQKSLERLRKYNFCQEQCFKERMSHKQIESTTNTHFIDDRHSRSVQVYLLTGSSRQWTQTTAFLHGDCNLYINLFKIHIVLKIKYHFPKVNKKLHKV